MPWAFWRREVPSPQSKGDAGPRRRGEWAQLPPIQRTVGPVPETGGGKAFVRELAGSHPPGLALEALGHEVSPEAPAGLIAAAPAPISYSAGSELVTAGRRDRGRSWVQRWLGGPDAPEPAPPDGAPVQETGPGTSSLDDEPVDEDQAVSEPAAEPLPRRLEPAPEPIASTVPLTVARLEDPPPAPRTPMPVAGEAPPAEAAGEFSSPASFEPARLTLGQSRRLGLGPPVRRQVSAEHAPTVQRSLESRAAEAESVGSRDVTSPPGVPNPAVEAAAGMAPAPPPRLQPALRARFPVQKLREGLQQVPDPAGSELGSHDLETGQTASGPETEPPDVPLPIQRMTSERPGRTLPSVRAPESHEAFWTPDVVRPAFRPVAGRSLAQGQPAPAPAAAPTATSIQRSTPEPLVVSRVDDGAVLDGAGLPPPARPLLPALPLEKSAGREGESSVLPVQPLSTAKPMPALLRPPVAQPAASQAAAASPRPVEPTSPLPLAVPSAVPTARAWSPTPITSLQRHSEIAAQAAPDAGFEPPAEIVPAVQRQEAGGSGAGGAAAGGAAAGGAHSEQDLDSLARQLYDRIRSHFRSELLIDRERAGLLVDRR